PRRSGGARPLRARSRACCRLLYQPSSPTRRPTPLLATMTDGPGRDGLGKGHVLAAQFHIEPAADSALLEVPDRRTRRAVPVIADQTILDGPTAACLTTEPASGKRRMIENGKFAGKVRHGDAALAVSRGIAQILLEVRHPG